MNIKESLYGTHPHKPDYQKGITQYCSTHLQIYVHSGQITFSGPENPILDTIFVLKIVLVICHVKNKDLNGAPVDRTSLSSTMSD
jgi:hypothetical protein